MTATRTEPHTDSPSGRWAAQDPLRVSPTRRRVSLPWVALGALLMVAGMLAGALTLANVGQRRAVLVVARPVPVGQAVTDQDLRVARVAAEPGLEAIPATARTGVIGRPAAVPLVPGSLLVEAALGQPAAIEAGEALVGVLVSSGQAPPGLREGATVQVLQAGGGALTAARGASGGDGQEARTLVERAVVVSVDVPDASAGEGLVVGLRVPAGETEAVAGAAAAGQVALAWVPGGAR